MIKFLPSQVMMQLYSLIVFATIVSCHSVKTMSESENMANKMIYKNLGNSGLRVSALSFGSWVTFGYQVGVDKAYELMKLAYDNGVNFFDNAEAYGKGEAETIMGEAIKKGIEEKTWERDDLVITTKIFFGTKEGPNARGLSRKHIVEGLQASLARLQLDYVDVVFCHRPDPLTPIEETVRAMNHVIERGWAFYWSTSEWSAQEITEACRVADKLGLMRPLADQAEYNLFKRDRVEVEYAPLYKEMNLGLTIWSPLASGILTGKYKDKVVPEGSRLALESYKWLKDRKLEGDAWQIEKTEHLRPIAEELGCSLAQLALAWCAKNDHVSTVILGATKPEQLIENFKALEFVEKLTPEVMTRIDEAIGTKPEIHRIHKQVLGLRT